MFQGLGFMFKIQGLEMRFLGLGFEFRKKYYVQVQGFELMVQGLGFRVEFQDLGFRIDGLGLKDEVLMFRVQVYGLELMVWSLELSFRVFGSNFEIV